MSLFLKNKSWIILLSGSNQNLIQPKPENENILKMTKIYRWRGPVNVVFSVEMKEEKEHMKHESGLCVYKQGEM